MGTKLLITSFGPTPREILIVLLEKNGGLRSDAVVSREVIGPQQIREIKIARNQALIILPAPREES